MQIDDRSDEDEVYNLIQKAREELGELPLEELRKMEKENDKIIETNDKKIEQEIAMERIKVIGRIMEQKKIMKEQKEKLEELQKSESQKEI